MTQPSSAIQALAKAPLGRLIWSNFLPAFAGVVVNSLYNIVDRVFIGQTTGVLALAGLSAVFPVMLIQHAFAMLAGLGTGVRASLALGQGRTNRARLLLGNGVVLAATLGLAFTILAFLGRKTMLTLFGIGPEAYAYAEQYLDIVLLGSVFHLVGFTMTSAMRAEGHPQHSMYATFASAFVNVILDALFVLVFDWGVRGAALATVLAQASQLAYCCHFFSSSRCTIPIQKRYIRFSWRLTGQAVSIGLAPFAMQLAGSLTQGLYNIKLVEYGQDIAVGAMGIINSVSGLLVMTVVSLNMAAQPIYGYCKGAKLYQRLRKCLAICLACATILACLGALLVQLAPKWLIWMFDSNTPELLEIGAPAMRTFFMLFPLVGVQIVSGNYFQSVGQPALSTFLSLTRRLIFLVPLLMVLPPLLQLKGVWLCSPISDLLSFFVCGIFLLRENKTLKQLGAQET